MGKFSEADFLGDDRRHGDSVARFKRFMYREVGTRVFFGRVRYYRSPPVRPRRAHHQRAPVYFFHLCVKPIVQFGRIPHARQPRRRHEHNAAGGITIKAEYNLTVSTPAGGTETNAVKPQRDRNFLHVSGLLTLRTLCKPSARQAF